MGSTTCCTDVAKKGDFHINLFWPYLAQYWRDLPDLFTVAICSSTAFTRAANRESSPISSISSAPAISVYTCTHTCMLHANFPLFPEHPQTTSIIRSQHPFSRAQEMRTLKVGFSSVLARSVFCTFPLFPPFLFPLFDCSSNSNSIGRRDIPPLMTSQALTISAPHTSSAVPTRPRRRHSLCDNEWRAIARALIAEVRRPFLTHHSTCQSNALGAGAILTLYPSTHGRAHHGAQLWDIGYPYEGRLTEGRLGPPRPSRLTRSWARPGAPTASPSWQPPTSSRCDGALLERPRTGTGD